MHANCDACAYVYILCALFFTPRCVCTNVKILSLSLLSYIIVLNSGHMVPMDLPAVSLDMITRFITRPNGNLNLEALISGRSRLASLVQPPAALQCMNGISSVSSVGGVGTGVLKEGRESTSGGRGLRGVDDKSSDSILSHSNSSYAVR